MIKLLKRLFRKVGFDVIRMPKHQLCNRDLFEHDVKVLIKQKRPFIIDVGANKGQSIDFFKKQFPDAFIYSFEPNPQLYTSLCNQYRQYNNIRVYPFALGDVIEEKELYIYTNNELSSLKKMDITPINPFSSEGISKIEQTKVVSLDEFLAEKNISIVHLLKIDTQGYEMEVLKGCVKSLQNGVIQNIYLELNFISIYENQSNYLDILDFLGRFNFQIVGLYELNRPEFCIRWANAFFKQVYAS